MEIATPSGASPFPKLTFDHKLLITKHLISNNDENRKTPDHLVGEMSSTSGIFENGAKSRLNHNETGGAVDNNSNNNNNISAATTREGQQSETESMSETQLNKSPLIQENKLVDFCNNNNGSLDGHNGNYERMKSIASGVSVGDGDGIVHDTVKPCNNNHQPNHHHSSNATINDNNNITLSNKNSDTNSVKSLVTSASAITTNTCATTTSLQETKFKKPELTMLNSINSNHHIPLQSPSIPYRKQSVFVAPAGLNLIIHENRNNHSVNHYKQQHQQLYNQQQHQLHTQTQHNQHHDHAGTATVSSFSSSLTSTSSSLSSYPSIAKGETSNGISLASSNSSITRKNSTGLQPKVNAQEIGQHINKLISENAAIVETTDSLYVKKYLSRHSVSSVPSGSHFAANNTTTTSSTASTSNGATPSMRRYSEIFVDPNHSTGSKLQSALLGRIVTTCPLTTDNTVVTPTNVPHAHISALTATNHQAPTKKFSEPIYPSVIMNMKQSRHQEQQQQSNLPTKKDSTSSLPIGGGSVLAQGSLVDPIVGPSLVRNLLTSSKNASTIKVIPVPVASHVSNAGGTPIIGIPSSVGPTDGSAKINPENPEGSIIKDLLLKARDSGEPSERKISRTNLTIAPIQEELSMLVYVCTLCKIAFRNKETLEAHQTHYCKADETQSTNDMSLNQLQLLNDHVQRKISVMESSFLQQQLTKPLPSTSNSKTSGSLFSQLQPKQQQQSQQQQQPIVGNILKQQLLAPSQGPPLKKRKTSEPVFPKSHLHHQQHHHIATAITNDISPLFRKTSVVQSSITKLIGPKLLPQESVPIEVDGIPSSLVSSVIVNSNSNSSCSNSTSLNSFSSTHVVSVINEPVTFPSTTVSLIQPTFSLPAWSSLSSSSSSSLASHSLSISSSSTTGANQSSLDKLSSPANGTKIEILPDYYPHLKYPKTKVTLTGPIVFPVLQKLLTEKKDNLEFHAQEISLGSSSTLSTSNTVGDAVGGTDVTINKTYLVYKQVPSIPEFEEEEKVEDDDEDKRNEVNASIQDDSDDDGNGSNSKMNGKITSETQTSNNQTAETVTVDVVVKKEESSSLTLSSKSEDVDEEMKTINNEDEDRKNNINEKELNRTYEENKSNNSEIPISSSSSSSLVPVSNGRVTVSNGSCRPTSLTLRKKNPINAFKLIGSTLVSPDTPRPKRKCMQLYINGQAYTHLGLKMSTRSTYCCIYRPQPMYVPQEAQSKLSMYSNWQIIAPHDDIFNQITPSELFHAYDTRQRKSFKVQGIKFTFAPSSESNKPLTDGFILTPSSYWIVKKQSEEKVLLKREILELKRKGVEELTEMMDNCVARKTSEDRLSNMSGFDSDSNDPNQPKRVKIFEGGFKSNEDYTYVRGRGRGKYVCEECGIRCKKPSMLKKHIRTHTDLRPYSCRHCAFAFKTKGNLTKHMKSKAHHKKCVELGIIPVPITIDDSQIDCDALAKQEAIERSYSGGNLASDDDDNDDEDGCEDDDDEGSDDEGVPIPIMTSSEIIASHKKMDLDVNNEPKEQRKSIIVANEIDEQEVARSLLVLSGSGEWSAPGGAVAGPTPSIRSSSTELKENRINTSLSYVSNKIDPTKPVDKLSEETKHVGASSGSANANNNSHFFNLSKWTPNIGNYSRQRSFSFNDGLIRNNPSYAHNLETLRVGKRDRPEKPEKPVEVNVQSPIIEPISTDDSNDSEVEDHFVRRYSMSVIQDKPSPFPWHQSRTGGAHSEEGPIDLSKRGDDMDLSIAEHGGVCVTGSSHPSGRRNTLSTPTASHPFVYKELAGYSGAMNAASFTEDGKSVCRICNKSFSKLSQLRLHVNIHFLERPFRCDSCGVSFRTKGHLQKHERSVTHFNKVNINMTFGTPTTDNPRPFKCDDCIIAFRIHGHLAKHLRSKAHIMKLECAGKLPCGMYADMERFGISLNEIDTNDCENSLQSLQSMAEKMYSKGGEVDVSWLKQSTNNNNEPNLTEETDKPRLLPASSGSFSSYHETQAPPASPPIQRSFSFSETNSRYGPITKRLSTPDGSQYRPQLFSSKNFHSFGPSSSATSQFKSTDMSTQSVSGSTSNMHLYTGSPLAPMTSGTNSHHPLTLSDHHPHHHHHHHSDYNFSSVISSAASSTSSRSSSSPSHYISPSSLTDHVQQQTVPTNIIGNPISNHNLPLPTLTSSNSLGDISCIIPGKPAMSSGSSNSQKTVIYSQQSSLNPTNHPSSFNSQLQPPLQAPPIPLSTTANQFIANDQTSTSAPLISVPLTTPATSVSTTTSSTTNITSIRSNTCHYCNQVFKSAKFLQVHLYCDHQQQRSSSPSLVNEKQHQPEITDKDHKNICDICRKSFPDALLLQKHLLSHSTPRPYVCDICDAGFTSASALASHLPTHSVPQTQGLVICHECGQKFMNQIDFHRHLQLHVNDTNTNVRDT